MIDPKEILKAFRSGRSPLFIIGAFEKGVTVLSQQRRAFNFVWAAIESGLIPSGKAAENATLPRPKVAIVGGGFAGLSVAAGLVAKKGNVEITIFERRDTLLPLQQGSDCRWLHPRIYDWPSNGSESNVAMLPLLNWTSARASDVVVQILTDWRKLTEDRDRLALKLYCNARHLQIHEVAGNCAKLQIEWVGEERNPYDGCPLVQAPYAKGGREDFDFVILAMGFGLESANTLSYWRNETIGQPSLDQPRLTYLVSGQGDGAMIDLLRLRIAQFRQDRILNELFAKRNELLVAIASISAAYKSDPNKKGLFSDLEAVEVDEKTSADFASVKTILFGRLRHDTEVVLRLKVKKLGELFDLEGARISFQNRLLVYLLYKCGGFIPSSLDEEALIKQYSIRKKNVIRRHGTLRKESLEGVLSIALAGDLAAMESVKSHQTDDERWPGGYFGFPGPLIGARALDNAVKGYWRKEYLPGPTELLATAFCNAIFGVLLTKAPNVSNLRITLHRTITFGSEELLQQCSEYSTVGMATPEKSTVARTFVTNTTTIGIAYWKGRVVRSKREVSPAQLEKAMSDLGLTATSRSVPNGMSFVLAIPLLEPSKDSSASAPVLGVIYIDSSSAEFYIDDNVLEIIIRMAQAFLDGITNKGGLNVDRVYNMPLTLQGKAALLPDPLPSSVTESLEFVDLIEPPKAKYSFRLNFDYSDFAPVLGLSG